MVQIRLCPLGDTTFRRFKNMTLLFNFCTALLVFSIFLLYFTGSGYVCDRCRTFSGIFRCRSCHWLQKWRLLEQSSEWRKVRYKLIKSTLKRLLKAFKILVTLNFTKIRLLNYFTLRTHFCNKIGNNRCIFWGHFDTICKALKGQRISQKTKELWE